MTAPLPWRLVVDRNAYTDFSVSVSPAVERAVARGSVPPTVYLNIFDRDSLTIGVNEDPTQVLDLAFCDAHGIEVRRRVNGGGAIYAGAGSIFVCFYLPTALPGVPDTARAAFPQVLGAVAETLRRRYGVPARYRPLNDVEVEGRKLMPTSLKIEDGVMTLRVLINVTPVDTAVAARAIPLPPEKTRDKVHKDMASRTTCLEREAGRTFTEAELERLTREVTEDAFGVADLRRQPLSDAERADAADLRARLTADAWLYGKTEARRFGDLTGAAVGRGRVKAVGGLIWTALKVRDGTVAAALVNGDWHPRPTDSVAWLEQALAGCPATTEALRARVAAFLARDDVEFAGIEAEDLAAAFDRALADLCPATPG
ncbi:lipoate--protein ligase family protein [Roseospira goensis]|uniref:Lipoate-protein ligase A n=1 Tax=Roseospira goensis TaxID=391922 RepID=A0A7W6RXS2_9PROT|nr:lipoate--protein ligase family protein [Roseospira goensis]MBB4285183.1 lipoate-protein ligase A [Roseospira goensis]